MDTNSKAYRYTILINSHAEKYVIDMVDQEMGYTVQWAIISCDGKFYISDGSLLHKNNAGTSTVMIKKHEGKYYVDMSNIKHEDLSSRVLENSIQCFPMNEHPEWKEPQEFNSLLKIFKK